MAPATVVYTEVVIFMIFNSLYGTWDKNSGDVMVWYLQQSIKLKVKMDFACRCALARFRIRKKNEKKSKQTDCQQSLWLLETKYLT